MAYRISREAEEDIILAYLEGAQLFGESQAQKYHSQLTEAFEILSDNPRMSPESLEYAQPVRIHPTGSHVIVYSVDDKDDVLIVRVRHEREDWATRSRE